ncbi:hypothetical protein OKW30_001395 [Paraburkholderia sp. Clong3]|uniref:hypothetical protein n=1 Tax=Paraburkholderia sp. Clong3 TaxID=2991061 RepID=UPI003D2321E9
MKEIENLKLLIAELEGHVTALVAFSNSLLSELPEARRQAIAAKFESQCEQTSAFLLGQPDPYAERQIAALQLTRDTIRGDGGSQARSA